MKPDMQASKLLFAVLDRNHHGICRVYAGENRHTPFRLYSPEQA